MGYWLARPWFGLLASIPHGFGWPDLADGAILDGLGIHVHDDSRYGGSPYGSWDGNIISCHLSKETGCYSPDWMKQFHASFLRGDNKWPER
jgi:hypothetical protein